MMFPFRATADRVSEQFNSDHHWFYEVVMFATDLIVVTLSLVVSVVFMSLVLNCFDFNGFCFFTEKYFIYLLDFMPLYKYLCSLCIVYSSANLRIVQF